MTEANAARYTRQAAMKSAIREILETVALAVLVFLILQAGVQNYRVEGSSMVPTLEDRQYLLVNKAVYMRVNLEGLAPLVPLLDGSGVRYPFHPPQRGDVVVFRFPLNPSRDFVKRVMALPGETVEIRQGVVFINGEPQEEPYVTHASKFIRAPVTLGPDEYYVLGDNRRASNDSRDWGPVPLENIVGKALVIYWPWDRLKTLLVGTWLP